MRAIRAEARKLDLKSQRTAAACGKIEAASLIVVLRLETLILRTGSDFMLRWHRTQDLLEAAATSSTLEQIGFIGRQIKVLPGRDWAQVLMGLALILHQQQVDYPPLRHFLFQAILRQLKSSGLEQANGLVQVTTNSGALASATFTNVTNGPLPNRFVTDIAADPSNSQRAVVVYSGFNVNTPTTLGHVFITNDMGNTWTNISGNLPDVPVTSVAIDPTIANTFYIGTDIGAFATSDGGTTWIALNNGMPKVAVFMLRYHTASRTIVAATHGRGMYRLDVSSISGNSLPTITSIQPSTAAFGSAAFTLTVNGSNFVSTSTVLFNGQTRATSFISSTQLQAQILASDLTAVGTVPVTVSSPAPGGGISNSVNFTVAKANQTITFGALANHTFGDQPFTINATASSGLAVSFSVLTGPATITNGNTVTITGAASVTIQANQAGNANFNAATPVQQSFTVAKEAQTITFTQPANHTFGDPQFFLSASASSGLVVTFSVVSGPAVLSGNGVTLTGAGTVTIQADQAGNANFGAAPSVIKTFTVAKENQTITFGALANHSFGDQPFTVSATASSGLPVSFSIASGPATINGSTVTITGQGTVVVQADQFGNANFNAAAAVQQSFVVAKQTAIINLSNTVQIFDGTPKSATVTTTPASLSGLTITYNGSTTPPTAIGNYLLLATLTNANFQANNASATFRIVGFSPTNSQNAAPGTQNTAAVAPGGTKLELLPL